MATSALTLSLPALPVRGAAWAVRTVTAAAVRVVGFAKKPGKSSAS